MMRHSFVSLCVELEMLYGRRLTEISKTILRQHYKSSLHDMVYFCCGEEVEGNPWGINGAAHVGLAHRFIARHEREARGGPCDTLASHKRIDGGTYATHGTYGLNAAHSVAD